MSTYFADSKLIWTPSRPTWTAVERFRRFINTKHGLNLEDFHALHKYSVEDYAFWADLWDFLEISSSVPPGDKILEPGNLPEVPRWFPAARLNYAENLLIRPKSDSIVITAGGESGRVSHYSRRELHELVRQMTCAMRKHGLQKGDRVAAIVNNTITSVVICLATASIGAIFSSTASDMGTQGVLDRYRQIAPKFIFSETEVTYAGKRIDLLPKVTQVFQDLRKYGAEQMITLPSLINGKEISVSQSKTLSQFLSVDDGSPLVFEQMPFSAPLFILYSSGTSGPPKCIVHSGGGVLLQNQKELKLHVGLEEGEAYFQYTTTGWMMWTFMLSGLALGARLLLYDGSPFHPDLHAYLKFINDQRVGVFGTSPRFLAEVQGRGINPLDIGSFADLKTLSVTGAVLTTPMFEWSHKAFGARAHILSPSGGTDVCSGFVGGCPSLPVYSGEMQCKSLGMAIEIFDQEGKNIEQTGVAGELVCTRPHVSLPLGFWGDTTGAKFRDAYYNMYPGIWRQGDFIVMNPKTQGLMILGRSDGVLNPSGVRFGSGEIYNVLEQFSSVIDDSLCVGQRRATDKDERVLLFLKMRSGHTLDDNLIKQIKDAIRAALSIRHVPAFILPIEDIPYTVNGKRIEIAVKQIVSGSNLKPSGTVANPESLKLYYKFRDLNAASGESVHVKSKM
ncbi:AMP-binding domain-containing protein [Mycena indigotica]|uniref:AMP-binding domain-containing protein n=1 Tax=Mycena indigotica TaxID=2126181 RepID=A0A8H6THG4_9AGAR|nr:AMP-binding domain-containing protein [Mycena indigotica]KAF7315820.1 AMP-binding domain-containing protein [Mycena indigotica]